MVAKASLQNTGGGEGVEVIKNEPCEFDGMKGQYTFKVSSFSSVIMLFFNMQLETSYCITCTKSSESYTTSNSAYTRRRIMVNFSTTLI
jgi:hypothetical protein